jgi:hypothetical protein
MTLLRYFRPQRHTGQSDITCLPIAVSSNRGRGIDRILPEQPGAGTELSDNPSFRTCWRGTCGWLDAYTHQDLPEKLLEELRPDRDWPNAAVSGFF